MFDENTPRKAFRNGTVITSAGPVRADVLVEGDKILDLVQEGGFEGAKEIDCRGKLLLPGLVDAHVHFRDPGMTEKEDFVSGSTAAIVGGVTTALIMPTDEPYTASEEDFADKVALASRRLRCDIGLQVAVRHDAQSLRPMRDRGAVSFEVFTADVPDPFLHDDLAKVQRALERVAKVHAVAGISPGDQSLLDSWSQLPLSQRIGFEDFCRSRPPTAEAMGIARAMTAAIATGCAIHIRQVNSRLGVEVIRRLRDLCDVSVETTVQCLLFDQHIYETKGALAKGSPPFRTAEDVAALRAAAKDGVIDIVATDHAPHTISEKEAAYETFAAIPGGMPGVQTLLPAMLKLVEDGVLSLSDVVQVSAERPAKRFGLGGRKGTVAKGHDADILVVDPGRSTRIRNADQISKAGYTLFDGMEVQMALEQVYLRGQLAVQNGEYAPGFRGQVLGPGAST
ncbi:dihydroorotase [Kaistia sp. 32K]|uniref:dihydroorotase n=1 Tax=Kaistia sp. 32K TaxID=2795690 RepID=UPI001915A388|nr:dihydroorotase family protein [Kaistia sp. 32K]BCP54005.1 dihydroorotase [Kaistia sp. 32K]